MMKLAGRPMTATLVLLTFTLAADPVPKVAPEPLPPEPKSDPTNVRELYDAYRYYGLPLPPKGSYLGKKEWTVKETALGKVVERTRHLIALFRDDEDRKRWKGFQRTEPKWETIQKYGEGHLPINMSGNVRMFFREHNWLIFAAQAHHLGWNDLAQLGLERGLKSDELKNSESKTPVLDWFRQLAWHEQYNQLLQPDSDRRAIQNRMQQFLCPEDREFHEYQLSFLRDLKQTVRPGWNRKGTPEDVIDGLVKGTKTRDDLLALGFDAVPAMIRHFNDVRFTREVNHYFLNNSVGSYHQRVSQVCRELLESMFEDVRRFNKSNPDVSGETGYLIEQDWETNEWLRDVRLLGERKWCVRNVIRSSEPFRPEMTFVNESLLVILREKYPDELPALIPKQTKHVVLGLTVLKSIAESRLTKKQKLAALHDAENNPAAWHPVDVVRARKTIDASAARRQFAAMLDFAARSGDLKKIVIRERDLAVLGALHDFDDPELWKSFELILPKIDTGTRIVMINIGLRHHDSKGEDEHIKERTACLLKLLDDTSPVPNEYEKNYTYLNLKPVTLGHLAMIQLSRLAQCEIVPKPDHTPAEWAAIREKVRVAAEKELAKK